MQADGAFEARRSDQQHRLHAPQPPHDLADLPHVLVADGVKEDDFGAVGQLLAKPARGGLVALIHVPDVDQADLALGLPAQVQPQIALVHRGDG